MVKLLDAKGEPIYLPGSQVLAHYSLPNGAIINIEALKEIQPEFSGAYALKLKSGTKLRLSRGYREKFSRSSVSSLAPRRDREYSLIHGALAPV